MRYPWCVYLSVRRRLDIGVALLTDDLIDPEQPIGWDGGESLGAVVGKVAVRTPRPPEVSRTLDQHGCRSECLESGVESESTGVWLWARGRGQSLGGRGVYLAVCKRYTFSSQLWSIMFCLKKQKKTYTVNEVFFIR